MRHISPNSRFMGKNTCQFYRKNKQDCWLGHKYISCDQSEELLLNIPEPCSNIMNADITATTTTAPQIPIYPYQTGQLSATNSLDFNSPPVILIFILIITLLVMLIVLSTTIIVIYSLDHCHKIRRPKHSASKSSQTRRPPNEEQENTINLSLLIRQSTDPAIRSTQQTFNLHRNSPQQYASDNRFATAVSTATSQRMSIRTQ
ncbi:unnamed protein product [Adineta ricciae]|uniref:Uncharacterized protein n=1 Tax=Adineta ricciae TaxID=249248 RepID=A0A815VUV5_ADIRI|nr:unnamed protein product [Adineta ricciae]